jgi:hypothetical protein
LIILEKKIKFDEKTIQKTQEILIDIGRDQKVDNAVAAFDAIEEQVEKHQLKELLALNIFWYSIWQFMVNFGDTSKDVFLDYVSRELGFTPLTL